MKNTWSARAGLAFGSALVLAQASASAQVQSYENMHRFGLAERSGLTGQTSRSVIGARLTIPFGALDRQKDMQQMPRLGFSSHVSQGVDQAWTSRNSQGFGLTFDGEVYFETRGEVLGLNQYVSVLAAGDSEETAKADGNGGLSLGTGIAVAAGILVLGTVVLVNELEDDIEDVFDPDT